MKIQGILTLILTNEVSLRTRYTIFYKHSRNPNIFVSPFGSNVQTYNKMAEKRIMHRISRDC